MKVKLAEALLRRKELQEQVNRLRETVWFEAKARRQSVSDSIDDVAKVPKVAMQCFNWHSKQLRLVDAAIQQANLTTELDVDTEVMGDYVDPYVKD